MGKALIAHNDIGTTATYSGGTWNGTLTPANQLTNRLITAKARTTDVSDLVLDLTLSAGDALSYDLVSLVNHNLTALATVQVQVFMNLARTVVAHDSGVLSVSATSDVDVTPIFSHYLSTPVSNPYLRLTIKDSGNSAGYLEFGRVHVATVWYPEFNVAYGVALGWDDLSEIVESTTGIEFYDKRVKRRTATLPYQILSDTERRQAEAIIGKEGLTGELLFCFDDDVLTTDYSRTFLARMSKTKDVRMVEYNLNTVSLSMQEVL
jgi:hypothetical protein